MQDPFTIIRRSEAVLVRHNRPVTRLATENGVTSDPATVKFHLQQLGHIYVRQAGQTFVALAETAKQGVDGPPTWHPA
jgi:hypothetical protein